MGLIPAGPCAWPFYPLLGFAMWGFALMLGQPVEAAEQVEVNVALWSGVVLALEFTLIQAIAAAALFSVHPAFSVAGALCLSGVALWAIFLIRSIIHNSGARRALIMALLVGAALFSLVSIMAGNPFLPFVLIPLGIAIAMPALTLACYVWMAWFADQTRRRFWKPRRPAVLGLSWLGAYFIAWDLCISCVVQQYSKLPKSPPSCYIASAAARGHRRFVRSAPCRAASGKLFFANNQLRVLKVAELAIAQLMPRTHRIMRLIYDRAGPPIAKQLRQPLLGDVAYVSLKPFEWGATCGLAHLFPHTFALVPRLYPA